MVICVEQSVNDFAFGPIDAIATPLLLASLKSRMVYLFGTGLHRLS